jgi:hypothetical protein
MRSDGELSNERKNRILRELDLEELRLQTLSRHWSHYVARSSGEGPPRASSDSPWILLPTQAGGGVIERKFAHRLR